MKIQIFILTLIASLVVARPTGSTFVRRQSEAEIISDAVASVTRDPSVKVSGDLDDFVRDGKRFSQIDFGKSDKNPLAFALETFAINDPAGLDDAGVRDLDTNLGLYIAYETELRANNVDKGFLTKAKVPKFFLQFQKARVQAAKGEEVTIAGGVEHQRDKVDKNARGVGASASDLEQLQAISAA